MARKKQERRNSPLLMVVVLGMLGLCCLSVAVPALTRLIPTTAQTTTDGPIVTDPRSATLTLAYSPEKSALMSALADDFNARKLRTDDKQDIRVELIEMSPEEMLNQALSGQAPFQALTPDSSLWLDQLNRRWAQSQTGAEPGTIPPRLTGDPVRYAVTPIVIAAWEDVARSLGWPDKAVSWTDLQSRARDDVNFKWSHPSTAHASGLLATLAEFYAGAGVQRGLTSEMVEDPKTLDFVSEIEKTVRYYGEAEEAVIKRAAEEGPDLPGCLRRLRTVGDGVQQRRLWRAAGQTRRALPRGRDAVGRSPARAAGIRRPDLQPAPDVPGIP